jgi:hypothetical protein
MEYVSDQLSFSPNFLIICRRDKTLFKPETIRKWVVVVFESERSFNTSVVGDMVKGFVQGARSVGENEYRKFSRRTFNKGCTGITIPDAIPLVRYAHGHMSVSKVVFLL